MKITFPFSGALCSFGAHYAASGKLQLSQIYLTGVNKQTNIINEPMVECWGRILAYTLQVAFCTLAGGLLTGVLEAGLRSGEKDTVWASRVLFVTWAAVVFAAWTVWNGTGAHTSFMTRRCVKMVERLVQKKD